jgi:hypothetical protein
VTIELAPDLAWVDELYGGVWPMVDEDRLFDLAHAWRRTAQGVRETDQKADWVARDVVTNNDGRPIDAFEQTWGRHHSNHQVMADADVLIAEIANSVGLAVQSTKIAITGIFALTATRLMHAKVNASYLPAPSAEEAFRSVAAGRRAIEMALRRLYEFIEIQISGFAFHRTMELLDQIKRG